MWQQCQCVWQWTVKLVANEFALGIGFEPGIGIDVYIALGIAKYSGFCFVYVDGVVDCDCPVLGHCGGVLGGGFINIQ